MFFDVTLKTSPFRVSECHTSNIKRIHISKEKLAIESFLYFLKFRLGLHFFLFSLVKMFFFYDFAEVSDNSRGFEC